MVKRTAMGLTEVKKEACPKELSPEQLAQTNIRARRALAVPTLLPRTKAADGKGKVVAGLQSNAHIAALRADRTDGNAWVWVENVGWRKLSNASESGLVALTVMGAHADHTHALVDYREECDGVIPKMYI